MSQTPPSSEQPDQKLTIRRLKRGAPTAEEAAAWIEANWEAIEASNAYVEKHGLPLAKYRQF